MNIPITASKLIDRAILLEEGGAIVIPCSSYEEMEKLRIRLYKLKRQLEEKYRDVALSLDIKRKVDVDANRWTIFITKDASLSGIFIVEGGKAKPFEEEVEPPELIEPEEASLPEASLPEADFDNIAAEMEKTQGLTEEVELPKKGELK